MSYIHSPFNDSYLSCDPKYFVGRKDLLFKFSNILKDCVNGKHGYFLIQGSNGIGKSSFLNYFNHCMKSNFKYLILDVYCLTQELNCIEKLIGIILSKLLFNIRDIEENLTKRFKKIFQKKSYYDLLFDELKDNIIEIGFHEIKFKKEFLNKIKDNFAEFLVGLLNKIDVNHVSIQIDTLGYSKNFSEFSNWVRDFIIDLENLHSKNSFSIFLVLQNDDANKFLKSNALFKDKFVIGEIKRLSDDEVLNFFNDCFNEIDWKIEKDVLLMMVDLSMGHPSVMNSLGLNVYYNCGAMDDLLELEQEFMSVHIISTNKFVNSKEQVLFAFCKNFDSVYYTIKGKKSFFDLVNLNDVGENSHINKSCLHILNLLAIDSRYKFDGEYYFKKSDFISRLTNDEKSIFDEYIKRLQNLGIIKNDYSKNIYKFKGSSFLIKIRIWSNFYKLNNEKAIECINRGIEFDRFLEEDLLNGN